MSRWLCCLGSAFFAAGCGLTLDYDPPTDAGGGGFDAPLLDAPLPDAPLDGSSPDAPLDDVGPADACSCAPPDVCTESGCRQPCASDGDCRDDDTLCERCGPDGYCSVASCASTGCAIATCNAVTDACETEFTCARGEVCVGDVCRAGRSCATSDECSEVDACDRPFVCVMSVCTPPPTIACPLSECADACCRPSPDVCPSERPFCSDALSCVECLDDGDCASGFCSRVGTCVECLNDSDCPGGTCNLMLGNTCTECGPTRVCDTGAPCLPTGDCAVELCGNMIDDDADGGVDEDCPSTMCALGPPGCDFVSACCLSVGSTTSVARMYVCEGLGCVLPLGARWTEIPICPAASGTVIVAANRTLLGTRERVTLDFDIGRSELIASVGTRSERHSFSLPRGCDGEVNVRLIGWDMNVVLHADLAAP